METGAGKRTLAGMQSSKATNLQLDLTSDLTKWRAFLAIAELGSLTRAALFLNSNQSLLSRHLNALERECNARLFNRTGAACPCRMSASASSRM
jgi:hypothetical protein